MPRDYGEGRTYPLGTEPISHAPSKFGQYSPVIKSIKIALDNARDQEKFSLGGSVIWAYDASGNTANIDVQFNTQQSDKINFRLGMSIGGLRFSEIYVTNAAQAGEYITLLYTLEGRGLQSLNPVAATASVIVSSGTVRQEIPDVFTAPVDIAIVGAAAAVAVLAANTNRQKAFITNPAANGDLFRIGDASTDATHGIEVNPGETLELETTQAIYAYSASNQSISLAFTAFS